MYLQQWPSWVEEVLEPLNNFIDNSLTLNKPTRMKKYFLLTLLVCTSIISKAQPPNNAIFFGGSGDGISSGNFSPAPNPIYLGSSGDGFANNSNQSIPNLIFLGGEGDGFSNKNFNPGPNNIFTGGEGDGWHAVLFPMGPLPVQLVSFNAIRLGDFHVLKWHTSAEINTEKFEVQRSINGVDFVTIGAQQSIGTAAVGAEYSFNDRTPVDGNNFYRLKMLDWDGSYQFSNVVLLKNIKGTTVAVFPNPTADILYVRISENNTENEIPATIIDASGKLVLQALLKKGSDNKIELNRLTPGIYTLRYFINQTPFALRFIKSK